MAHRVADLRDLDDLTPFSAPIEAGHRSFMNQTSNSELACFDGIVMPADEARLPVTDDGLLRGDGVFEALRVYAGVPFGLTEHLQRLVRSAEGMMLELDIAQVERDVNQLIEARGPHDFQLRFLVTRGGHRLVLSETLPVFAPSISLATVEYRSTGILDGLKTLSYGANMQAGRIARSRGFDEALLVSPEGIVLEAPTASFFFSTDGQTLVTPPLGEGILASITRATLLSKIDVLEREVRVEELAGATESFICASIREVHCVSAIDSIRLPVPGPLTAAAQKAYRAAVEAACA